MAFPAIVRAEEGPHGDKGSTPSRPPGDESTDRSDTSHKDKPAAKGSTGGKPAATKPAAPAAPHAAAPGVSHSAANTGGQAPAGPAPVSQVDAASTTAPAAPAAEPAAVTAADVLEAGIQTPSRIFESAPAGAGGIAGWLQLVMVLGWALGSGLAVATIRRLTRPGISGDYAPMTLGTYTFRR